MAQEAPLPQLQQRCTLCQPRQHWVTQASLLPLLLCQEVKHSVPTLPSVHLSPSSQLATVNHPHLHTRAPASMTQAQHGTPNYPPSHPPHFHPSFPQLPLPRPPTKVDLLLQLLLGAEAAHRLPPLHQGLALLQHLTLQSRLCWSSCQGHGSSRAAAAAVGMAGSWMGAVQVWEEGRSYLG